MIFVLVLSLSFTWTAQVLDLPSTYFDTAQACAEAGAEVEAWMTIDGVQVKWYCVEIRKGQEHAKGQD